MSPSLFGKKVAEINRYEPLITTYDESFKIAGCDLLFSKKDHTFLVDRFDFFRKLLRTPGVQFELIEGRLILRYGGVSLIITTAEELFIFYEIFIGGCYRVHSARPFNVIDVGMNVGFASLFFASQPFIHNVFSFEPFRPTYNDAIRNFQMNAHLSGKVHAHNYGLARQAEKRMVSYSSDLKGKNSMHSGPGNEQIELRDVSAVLDEIFSKSSGELFCVKMDCEGAEFEIFERLKERPINDRVFGFIIEWHNEDPMQIIDVLVSNAFHVHVTGKQIGLITAFR
jgi:FkbM family methyltransferase